MHASPNEGFKVHRRNKEYNIHDKMKKNKRTTRRPAGARELNVADYTKKAST
jgi:hypothetical protein